MKTLTLIATLALATTSFANLGETLPQLKQRFKDSKYTTRIKENGETTHIFTGKNQQVFVMLGTYAGQRGVSVLEIYAMSTPFSPEIEIDLANAVAPGNTWHTTKEMPGDMISDNGRYVVTLGNPPDGYMWSVGIGYALAGFK